MINEYKSDGFNYRVVKLKFSVVNVKLYWVIS